MYVTVFKALTTSLYEICGLVPAETKHCYDTLSETYAG